MSDHAVLVAQIAILEAQVAIFQAHVASLRALLEPVASTVPKVTLVLPERCEQVRPEHCAIQDPDARLSRATLADPQAWQCAGCRYRESMAGVVES